MRVVLGCHGCSMNDATRQCACECDYGLACTAMHTTLSMWRVPVDVIWFDDTLCHVVICDWSQDYH